MLQRLVVGQRRHVAAVHDAAVVHHRHTVAERTRQIGVLKSLGASKFWIAWVFVKEALLISLLGVVLGLAIAILARYALVNGLGMNIDLEANSIIYSSVAGLGAGLLGALYPAMRAASQDPVKALSYE